jgi:hypothetical protein
MKQKISVIIPCYNQAHFLPDALNSILSQTYENWECIIINDGSPDNTEEVALEWSSKDSRFIYLKKENGGLSSARNAGLKNITGQYIQFLDADDVINKDKFELQINQLIGKDKLALAYCDYFCCSEKDINVKVHQCLPPRLNSNNYLEQLISDWEVRLSIPCHCFLFDSRIFIENKIYFNESLPNHEDLECWIRVFNLQPQVTYIDSILAVYRIRENRMSADIDKMRKGYVQALKLHQNTFHKNKYLSTLIKNRISYEKYGENGRRKFHKRLTRFLIHIFKK